MNMKTIAAAGLCLGAGALLAAPSIKDGSVTLSQDGSHKVTIAYELEGEAAVVTVDILTNGVSVGGAHLQTLTGDVNKRVAAGARTAYWQPHKDIPGATVEAGQTRAVVTAWSVSAPPDYCAVSLVAANTVRYYADADAVWGGATNDLYKTDWMLFRKIPAAGVKYRMGSPENESGRRSNETAHIVELTYDYYLAVYELTQQQYINIHDGTASGSYYSKTDDYPMRPVEQTTFNTIRGTNYDWPTGGHAVAPLSTLGRLRARVGDDLIFDLPTEAQWEYACRAGSGLSHASANGYSASKAYHRSVSSDGGSTVDSSLTVAQGGTGFVGSKLPNDWGLYDTLGNVSEACLDWYVADNTTCDPETGPASSSAGTRVRRGGGYNNGYVEVRCAYRVGVAPGTSPASSGGYRFAIHLH